MGVEEEEDEETRMKRNDLRVALARRLKQDLMLTEQEKLAKLQVGRPGTHRQREGGREGVGPRAQGSVQEGEGGALTAVCVDVGGSACVQEEQFYELDRQLQRVANLRDHHREKEQELARALMANSSTSGRAT